MRRTAIMGVLAALAAGCGGDGDGGGAEQQQNRSRPADEVRRAATDYLQALRTRDWERACRMMTASARRELEGALGASCPQALSAGGALPTDQLRSIARELPGARVAVRGDTATIGPIGPLQQPLRLRRQGGSWLVAGA